MTYRNLRRAATGSLAAGLLAGCSLDVETPGIVDPDNLNDETSLPALRAGALGDFAVAFAGDPGAGDEGLILVGGLRADEFINRDTFEERRDIDLGTARVDNGTLRDLFRTTHRARRSAEFASARFRELGPTQPGYAETLNLAGYSTMLLGEMFCPGVPFSSLDASGAFSYGPPLSREQIFQRALAKFDSALTAAASGTGAAATVQANLARVGRGRALLGLGRIADARAAVTAVPTSFVYNVEYSENTSRQNNAVFTFNNINRRWGVANGEGGIGLPFFAANDPRVPVTQSTRNGLDGVPVRILNQGKYPARTTSIRLASGVEARLIEGEGALQAGESAAALTLLNGLRSGSTLPALSFAGLSARQQQDLLFRERGFWLFAESHRLGDFRRLLRAPYNRTYAEVFPTGAYFKQGRTYAVQPSLPIPLEEENNPQFNGCTAAN